MPKKIDIAQLAATHFAEFDAIRHALAFDFETSSQVHINRAFERIGVVRFPPGGDDVWEMVRAYQEGRAYQRPPRRLVERWRTM